MKPDEQERVITNMTNTMTKGKGAGCKSDPVPKKIQQLNLYHYYRVDNSLGERTGRVPRVGSEGDNRTRRKGTFPRRCRHL